MFIVADLVSLTILQQLMLYVVHTNRQGQWSPLFSHNHIIKYVLKGDPLEAKTAPKN